MSQSQPFTATYVHSTNTASPIGVRVSWGSAPVKDTMQEARPRTIGPQYIETQRPKVIIVGAGIAGLSLGVLLQMAGIEFRILERGTEFDHAESAIFLNATTRKFFQQIGALEEIMSHAKSTSNMAVANEDRKVEYTLEFGEQAKLFGSIGYIIPRRVLHNILVSRIERQNIVMGKRVLTYIPGNRYVTVKCSTGDLITCDILVGADGVFSAVRQNLYDELNAKGLLPPKDSEDIVLSTVRLVGQTIPLDPKEFPSVNDENCHFVQVIGDDKPYSDSNKVFANTTFDYSQALSMAREVMNFPIITGGPGEPTVKDLLKYTTTSLKKIVLEEKLFKTWCHGRVVLIGNACHKMNPSGGSGATNSIHDAISLANYIVSLPHWCEQKDIDHRFKAYQDERMPWVKAAFENNKLFKGMVEKNLKAIMIRLYAKTLTGAVARSAMMKMNANRPLVAFLEYVPDTGTVPSEYQPSYHFTLEILKNRAAEEAEVEARAKEMKDNVAREASHASNSSPVLIPKAPLTPALAAIAEASAIATARSAADAVAAAASLPKNALETFQTTPSKAKKPVATIV
ncbi:hypothetical protein EC957_007817 [Mortierella hygrophila]|uniref:FAD-binding domain-containing protein n=1 Tax=Mortierella hygrophila TaxID=979708 RepID=A0A9P6JYD7_9FUNG|nr:hypothetical protein EC957_007817 [Mortierella hygrophila]